MSLIVSAPRRQQPQTPVDIAAQYKSGALAYIGGQSSVIGASYSRVGTVTPNPTPAGVAVSSGLGSYISVGAVKQAVVGASWVIQLIPKDTSLHYVSGTVDTATNYLEDFAVNSDETGAVSAGKLRFGIRDDGGASRFAGTTNSVLRVGAVHTVCLRIVSGSVLEIWVDGINQAVTYSGTGTIGQVSGTTDNALAILNRNVRGTLSEGTGVDLLLYLRTPRPITNPQEITASQSSPWQLFAPLPRRIWAPRASAGAYTVTASAGSYAVTGQAATLTKSRVISAAAGAYAITGQAATITYVGSGVNYTLTAAAGAYAITGQAATITYSGAAAPYIKYFDVLSGKLLILRAL